MSYLVTVGVNGKLVGFSCLCGHIQSSSTMDQTINDEIKMNAEKEGGALRSGKFRMDSLLLKERGREQRGAFCRLVP